MKRLINSHLNLWLIIMVVLISFVPIFFKGGEYTGTDDQAKTLIAKLNPQYRPWTQSLWKPPSGEIESLIFALQAAAGAGFIGYYLGFKRGKRKAD